MSKRFDNDILETSLVIIKKNAQPAYRKKKKSNFSSLVLLEELYFTFLSFSFF